MTKRDCAHAAAHVLPKSLCGAVSGRFWRLAASGREGLPAMPMLSCEGCGIPPAPQAAELTSGRLAAGSGCAVGARPLADERPAARGHEALYRPPAAPELLSQPSRPATATMRPRHRRHLVRLRHALPPRIPDPHRPCQRPVIHSRLLDFKGNSSRRRQRIGVAVSPESNLARLRLCNRDGRPFG